MSTCFNIHNPSNNIFLLPSRINLRHTPTNFPAISWRNSQLHCAKISPDIVMSRSHNANGQLLNKMKKFHEVVLKVRRHELDQFGVVNNSVYASYCDHGRFETLERIIGATLDDTISGSGNALAVTELSLKYIAPLKGGDVFVVKSRIKEWSTARIYFEHLIFKLPNQEPILESTGATVWLDKNYRPIRIPQEFLSKVIEFYTRMDFPHDN